MLYVFYVCCYPCTCQFGYLYLFLLLIFASFFFFFCYCRTGIVFIIVQWWGICNEFYLKVLTHEECFISLPAEIYVLIRHEQTGLFTGILADHPLDRTDGTALAISQYFMGIRMQLGPISGIDLVDCWTFNRMCSYFIPSSLGPNHRGVHGLGLTKLKPCLFEANFKVQAWPKVGLPGLQAGQVHEPPA